MLKLNLNIQKQKLAFLQVFKFLINQKFLDVI